MEKKKIHTLSKGMAQKVQFIAAILHEPELIIFDEPFSGLDPLNVEIIRQEILTLKKNGHSILLSTHRMQFIENLCDEITFIDQGKNILQGKPQNIQQKFKRNEYIIQIEVNEEHLWQQFLNRYTLSEITKKKISYTFKINLSQLGTTNHLLESLMPIGKILRYQEIVPTLEEIFLKIMKNTTDA